MCGVVGALVLSPGSFRISEPYLMRMRDSLVHRGPTGPGYGSIRKDGSVWGIAGSRSST
jgi:asparagine synthase (glutamine-hydrolysing)